MNAMNYYLAIGKVNEYLNGFIGDLFHMNFSADSFLHSRF